MENLTLIPSKLPIPIGTLTRRRLGPHRIVSCELRTGIRDGDSLRTSKSVFEQLETESFACISSSTINSPPPTPVASPSTYIGSPMLWIGVGIGLSALFSVVATKLKRRAILLAFKTLMGPDATQSGGFNTAAFSRGSPFPFPATSPSAPFTSFQTPVASQPAVKGDDIATKMEALASTDVYNRTELPIEALHHGTSYICFPFTNVPIACILHFALQCMPSCKKNACDTF